MGSISLQHVKKSFGEVEIIPDISLDIKEGEFVVFVGPSGCGKSTLLRLIAGLEDVSGGVISIDGKDVTNVSPAERLVDVAQLEGAHFRVSPGVLTSRRRRSGRGRVASG